MNRHVRFILGFVISCCCVQLDAAQLTHIAQQVSAANKTTIYCSVNGPFTHKLFVLTNPTRVVLDLNGATISTNLKQLHLTNALVTQVRSGLSGAHTLRLVFDVSQRVQVSSAPWQEHGTFRGLRLDLIGTGERSPVIKPITPQVSIKTTSNRVVTPLVSIPTMQKKAPIQVQHSPVTTLRDVIVVLDAGHGGKDPGAHGPRNSREKYVVLAIAMKLKYLIDQQPGMRAVLTRSGDYYVGLRDRLDIARRYNGDIFVSIHADAFNNPHSNGASVFALSPSGATSEAARWIAEKENYSELGGVNLGDLDDSNGVVRSVLIDLSQTATINSSLQMGGRVLSQLNGLTRLHSRKVEQARFMVLKSPDIPSILVETGFISNPIEEQHLTNSAYQTRLSQAIFQGIKGYFWSNPPHGTRIEAMVGNNVHIVHRGETLPIIANRYHVSPQVLQASNHLPTNPVLSTGQKLVIPS